MSKLSLFLTEKNDLMKKVTFQSTVEMVFLHIQINSIPRIALLSDVSVLIAVMCLTHLKNVG